MDRILSATVASSPLPCQNGSVNPSLQNLHGFNFHFPPVSPFTVVPRFPFRPFSTPHLPLHRLEGNSHCLRDSWGLRTPGSPRAPHPSRVSCWGCSASRPVSGAATVVTTIASSPLIPQRSSLLAFSATPPAAGECEASPVAMVTVDYPRPQQLSAGFSSASGVPRAQEGAEVRKLLLVTDQSKGPAVNLYFVPQTNFARET